MNTHDSKPATLGALRASGWKSRSVKDEIRDNLLRALVEREELFPGIVGYDDTVIPEICIAILAGHDMLFMGEKGQAKSRLMRGLVRFLDPEIPHIAVGLAHDDPYHPITQPAREAVAQLGDDTPIAWWPWQRQW